MANETGLYDAEEANEGKASKYLKVTHRVKWQTG